LVHCYDEHERELEMICALIMCRDGVLPAGSIDAFVAAGHHAVVVGHGASAAAQNLPGLGVVHVVEVTIDAVRVIASQLRHIDELAASDMIVLPASPDGRDLAPHIALAFDRPLLTGATRIRGDRVTVVRADGLLDYEHRLTTPSVVTLIPGLVGTISSVGELTIRQASLPIGGPTAEFLTDESPTVRHESLLPADPTTMDLTEAGCIVAGGQGLANKAAFDQLGRIGGAIGGSLGGTRVASDAGWIPFERQIGTTGVAVNPRVYLAFAISGATQHTSGLGAPDHVISVNTDASCPMMSMSNVAIVSDAVAVLAALEEKLSKRVVEAHGTQQVELHV
jgi:electron transfer flavoprotein alpha subunit